MRKPLSISALGALFVAAWGGSWPSPGLAFFDESAQRAGVTGVIALAQAQTPEPAAQPPAAPAEGEQATQPPAGDDQAAEQPQAPGWAVNCKSEAGESALDCNLSQTVVLRQGGQVLAKVTFVVPASPKKPVVVVQLPLRLYLPAGAKLQIDENAPQALNFRACDRSGCYAQSEISAETLASLRNGKQLTVGFKNLAEQDITVPLSLSGFGDAYAKIDKPS